MFTLKLIRHSEVSETELNEIIIIKSVAWPYPREKQLEWLKANLRDSDLHLLLLNNEKPFAYLNLINIELGIDHKVYGAYGIGNVCSIEKGKGYGDELMKQVNKYIISENKLGLLFCKQSLVDFYKKQNWKLIDKNQITLSLDNSHIKTMIFNYNLPFIKLIFTGRPF